MTNQINTIVDDADLNPSMLAVSRGFSFHGKQPLLPACLPDVITDREVVTKSA